MATPTPPSTGPNIGASRLLGTNGLQQAVDSLTTQINRLTTSVGTASRNISGSSGSNGGGAASSVWNANSNRSNYGNGGGGRFTLGSMNGNAANGGGGSFAGMTRTGATVGAIAGVGSALVNYAGKNMADNFQYDYFGSQAITAGGGQGGRAANNLAISLIAKNNYVGLSASDRVKAGYINQYAFGAPQFNGQANPGFLQGQTMSRQFAYASPTLGATGGAFAAQQTFTSRSLGAFQSFGYASPFKYGGGRNTIQTIAQSILTQSGLSSADIRKLSPQNISAAFAQGGGLQVNLQALANRAGWSQGTLQEYQNIIRGQLVAQSNGMSANKYYQLLDQAGQGKKNASTQLYKATGMGNSMFENQRNLNATRTNRQIDILQSLAPAFDAATQAVNKFSQALNTFLQSTGLDKAIGTGAGALAPFSSALSGFSGAFGAGAGLFGAARMFGRGGGLLGRLGGLFGRGGAGAAARTGAGGLIDAGTAGAGAGEGGASVITSLGAGSAAGAGEGLLAGTGFGAAALGVGIGGHMLTKHFIKNKTGRKWANVGVDAGAGALTGAAIGSVVPVLGTGVGAAIGGVIGAGIGIFGGATGEGGVTGTTGNSARNSSTKGATTASAAQIIKYAETQLGVPYVWGGEQPGKAFDCSGLTQWAYAKAGVTIPRVAADQQKIGQEVPVNKTQPGDLLFVGSPAHHVVMNAGGGKIIEAPHPGSHVLMRALNPSEYTSATRIVGSIGNMNSLLNGNTDNSSGNLNNQQSTAGGDIGNLSGTSEAAAIASALAGSAAGIPMVASSQNTSTTTGAGTGSNPKATGSNASGHLKAYAKALLGKYGWSNQWDDFNALEMSEAGWNVSATNPSSGAYGLAQALPASKYSSAGKDWKTSGETQLRWMMDYIKSRYGSPSSAWSFHQKNNWYAAGAWNIDKDQPATVHKGEMIIPAQQAETIRQTLVNNTFNPNLQRAAGVGSRGASITFGDINVNLPNTYSGTAQEAQQIGKTIVEAMDQQLRLKNLQIGQ